MKKKILKNKIGIFQGRLTDSDFLQNYPDDWKRETFIAKYLSYSHIEFFLEEKKNNLNPFWSKKGRNEINTLLNKNFKNKKFLLCDNYIIKNNLYNLETYKYLKNVLNNLINFKNSKLILPLNNFYFKDEIKLSNYFNNILKYKNSKIEISFEIDTDNSKINKFFKLLKIKGCGVTLDTGNIYKKNKSILKTFLLNKKLINHIHIKDRNYLGHNVELGTGLINFRKFISLIKKEKYNNSITLETFRKKNSIITGYKNLVYLNKYL